ncbi:ATP-binding protein [Dechloromonas sp. H13]|uniref:ATP-binding protein n=1 Tax=Dechloromonas sp. H13 TaxID=2570193 RepID=UPI001290A023|nr:ATP-binding protein [Dechloromonas sp. H13]
MDNQAFPTRPKSIKAAFLRAFGLALLVIMGVFATAIYMAEAKVRDRDLAERAPAVAALFAVKLGKDSALMHAVGHAMMGNAAIAQAFRQRNRQALEDQGRELFEILRTDHRITHLYFDLPDRVNLYRFHSPDRYGDKIDRATMLQAHSRSEPVNGLELGPLGTLTLRMVMPWRQGRQHLGYIEVGEEIEHLISEVSATLAVDLAVLVNKRYLAEPQWQQGQDMMNRQGDWSRFASHVVQAQTMTGLPATLDETVLARLLAGKTVKIKDQGRSLHAALAPLDDAAGHHIGELLLIRDISDLEATFNGYMAVVILLSLGVAAGVFGVFYVALERVDKDYQRQHELEHRLLRMNTEHQRILQLEKLSALGTMVGGIAHQLNNPLVGVVNMAELAAREADDPDRTRELLDEIQRAGRDCRSFVRRMLEFSKVSRFESRPTPIADLINDTVLMFRQTEARHLPVAVELPDPPPELLIDPILVRHALFNLLQNAAQATDGQAGITIRLVAGTDEDSGAPGWSLIVADQGRGIAPEALDKLFVPFFTTRSDGTGLGLPVVQQVALLHHGHVSARNRPQGGAEFALWLPR